MKKLMVVVLGVIWIAAMTGCQKKESAEAPIQQPMVSEQPAAVNAMGAVATEPVAPGAADIGSTANAVTEAAAGALEQAAASSAPITKPTPQQIQQALKNAGLYAGKIDGSLGPKTKRAIEEFQAQNGLNADGKVGPKTWAKLGTHLNGATAVVTEPIMPADTSATGMTNAEPSN